jgi:hypothetical protein
MLAVPPAAFALTWAGMAFVQRRTADPGRRRRQAALRTAKRRLAQARSQKDGASSRALAAEIGTILTGYLADRFNEPPARFIGLAAVDFLRGRGLRPDVVEQWTRLLARCEEASFAGGTPADDEALAGEALACLTRLERQRL